MFRAAACFAWQATLALGILVAAVPSQPEECCQCEVTSLLQFTQNLATGRRADPTVPKHSLLTVHKTLVHGQDEKVIWSAAQNLIWSDDQCENLGNMNKQLLDCKALCENTAGCTAINHNPSNGDCVLRSCAVPTPRPSLSQEDYLGYSAQAAQQSTQSLVEATEADAEWATEQMTREGTSSADLSLAPPVTAELTAAAPSIATVSAFLPADLGSAALDSQGAAPPPGAVAPPGAAAPAAVAPPVAAPPVPGAPPVAPAAEPRVSGPAKPAAAAPSPPAPPATIPGKWQFVPAVQEPPPVAGAPPVSGAPRLQSTNAANTTAPGAAPGAKTKQSSSKEMQSQLHDLAVAVQESEQLLKHALFSFTNGLPPNFSLCSTVKLKGFSQPVNQKYLRNDSHLIAGRATYWGQTSKDKFLYYAPHYGGWAVEQTNDTDTKIQAVNSGQQSWGLAWTVDDSTSSPVALKWKEMQGNGTCCQASSGKSICVDFESDPREEMLQGDNDEG